MFQNCFSTLIVIMLITNLSGIFGCFGSDDSDNEPTPFPQSMLDKELTAAINKNVSDIYNQNLAGKSTGNKDETFSCPLGGEALLTGNVGYDKTHGITTVDLTYAMTDCMSANTHTSGTNNINVSITLNGSLKWTGSFGNDYTNTSSQAQGLQISGTATHTRYEAATIDQTCDFSASTSYSGSSGSVTAILCGRDASWSW